MSKIVPIIEETVKDVFENPVSPGDKVIVVTTGYGVPIRKGVFKGIRPHKHQWSVNTQKRFVVEVPVTTTTRYFKSTGKKLRWTEMHTVPGLDRPHSPRIGWSDPEYKTKNAKYEAEVDAYNKKVDLWMNENAPYQTITSVRNTTLWLNKIIKE